MQIPKWLRLLLAWILIGIGLPLFLTPLPGGFFLAAAGVMLLFCASPPLRSRLWKLTGRFPKLARRLKPMFSACEVCPNDCRTHAPKSSALPTALHRTTSHTDNSQSESV